MSSTGSRWRRCPAPGAVPGPRAAGRGRPRRPGLRRPAMAAAAAADLRGAGLPTTNASRVRPTTSASAAPWHRRPAGRSGSRGQRPDLATSRPAAGLPAAAARTTPNQARALATPASPADTDGGGHRQAADRRRGHRQRDEVGQQPAHRPERRQGPPPGGAHAAVAERQRDQQHHRQRGQERPGERQDGHPDVSAAMGDSSRQATTVRVTGRGRNTSAGGGPGAGPRGQASRTSAAFSAERARISRGEQHREPGPGLLVAVQPAQVVEDGQRRHRGDLGGQRPGRRARASRAAPPRPSRPRRRARSGRDGPGTPGWPWSRGLLHGPARLPCCRPGGSVSVSIDRGLP